MAHKRPRSGTLALSPQPTKVLRASQATFAPNKVASAANAANVDANPPMLQLVKAVEDAQKVAEQGDTVVYWMRMQDIRVRDNTALSEASSYAQRKNKPLIACFLISPQDYIAHDRGPRKIDFILRNIASCRRILDDLNIPLFVSTIEERTSLPQLLVNLLSEWKASAIYANMEYEVDELRRDIEVCSLVKKIHIRPAFLHDKCIIPPSTVKTKDGKTHAVYSPFQRLWLSTLNKDRDIYLHDYGLPHQNPFDVREKFSALFDSAVPSGIPGFELQPGDDEVVHKMWPAGEEIAQEIVQRFMTTWARDSQMGAVDPLSGGEKEGKENSRVNKYHNERDLVTKDTTSRLSPYLAAGVISARSLVRTTMELKNLNKVDGSRDTGAGRWVQELAWRDFYVNILVGFPRVSMGRPYLEQFSSIEWEEYQEVGKLGHAPSGEAANYKGIREGGDDNEALKAWKEGRTGYPIVDASMRCLNQCGWVHNRGRMIAAMFLTKDLLIDWRVGERYFMQNLIDGDLASNNGGWQWSASTGVDPCPYFRIFNPYLQSSKVDPDGDFIRAFVPELADLTGKDIHNPNTTLCKKRGYPLPIVKHDDARKRALDRFKKAKGENEHQ